MTDREAMKLALEALEMLARYENPETRVQVRKPKDGGPIVTMYPHKVATDAADAIRTAIAEADKQEPVAWTEREKELIDGMIEVQLDHARRCDNIANRTMAEKQKNWDMERVTLLQKIKATPPAAQRQWVGLTDEEMHECWGDPLTPLGMKHARMIEAKLREKNT